MKTIEESVVTAMDGTDTEILPFLTYILQDFDEIGTSPAEVITLIEKHIVNQAQLEVLDLGCGKGTVSVKLAERCQCYCLGIDAINEFIEIANNKAKELGVDILCEFRVADIRKEINNLGEYDVIILGAIGQVFGEYYETLTTLLPHLKNGGVIIVNDGYIENDRNISRPVVLEKREMLRQIDSAGMTLIDEIRADEDTFEKNDNDFDLLTKRCNELIAKHPEKAALFQDYIDNQQKEYESFETNIICSIMLLKRK